jgi:arylsulfatase A-like enzyme
MCFNCNRLLLFVGLALTAGLLLGTASSGIAADQPPNIILAMSDDQGYGDAEYMGHPRMQTPTMNEMARQGLRLDRFYATPICSPTRAAVLTGRHPNRNGTFEWGHALRPAERTVAEALNEAGYRTGHFGKWHVGSVRRGADTNPGAQGFDVWVSTPNFYENDPIMSRQGRAEQLHGESSVVTVDEALKFIDNSVQKDKPFLAVVWFGNPHRPHEAIDELQSLYPDMSEGMAHYLGEMTGIDRSLNRLRQRLRELDIEENTVLWYNSDNGGHPRKADNGGLRGHKGQLWEGGTRVPAIIEWPGHIEPRTSTMPTYVGDIYPTVLDLAGVERAHPERPLDGVSLMPMIEGSNQQRDKAIPFWRYPIQGKPTPSEELMGAMLKAQSEGAALPDLSFARHAIDDAYPKAQRRAGRAAWLDEPWKLHRRGDGKYRLYNLQKDPKETNNVIDQHPERAQRMKQQLKQWQQSVHQSLQGKDY